VLGPLLRGDAEKERALREIEDGMAQHWAMLDEAGRLAAAGRRAEALAYVRGTAHPRFKATRDLMAGLRESINSDADGRVRANRAALSKASVRMAVCTIAVALLSVLSATCGLAVSRRG
jgi:CHASE3 domain sensor protein